MYEPFFAVAKNNNNVLANDLRLKTRQFRFEV